MGTTGRMELYCRGTAVSYAMDTITADGTGRTPYLLTCISVALHYYCIYLSGRDTISGTSAMSSKTEYYDGTALPSYSRGIIELTSPDMAGNTRKGGSATEM